MSKKRKFDEVKCDSDDSNETVVVKWEKDIQREETVENINEEPHGKSAMENSGVGNISIVPISKLTEISSQYQNDEKDLEIEPNIEETIGWNFLLEKIDEIEEKITKKIRLEMLALKESWEENTCKCRLAQKKELEKLNSEISRLRHKNEQNEEEKQLLMKEKTELEESLKKERGVRSRLAGILTEDDYKPVTDSAKNIVCNNNLSNEDESKNEKSNSSKINIAIKKDNREDKIVENVSANSPRENCTTSDPKTDSNKNISLITYSLKDKMPNILSDSDLIEEIKTKWEIKRNIIMKGMRYQSWETVIDEVTCLIRRKTGIMPKINEITPVESNLLLKMASMTNKIAIMKRRALLRPLRITLHNCRTSRESKVQSWLEDVAREEEKLGKHVEVAFYKIKLDGEWKMWNERTGQLVTYDKVSEQDDHGNDM